MTPLGARLADAGLPAGPSAGLLPAWFAGVLRDGIALTLAGGRASFTRVAGDGLRTLLAGRRPGRNPGPLVDHVLAGLPEPPVQPDVPAGVRALHTAGRRMPALTNGSAGTTRAVLARAGLEDCFEAHLDIAGSEAPGNRTGPPTHCAPPACRPSPRCSYRSIPGTPTAPPAQASARRGCAAPPSLPVASRPAGLEATGATDLARCLGAVVG